MLTPAYIPAFAASSDCLAVFGHLARPAVPGWWQRGKPVSAFASEAGTVGSCSEEDGEGYHKPVLLDEVLNALQPEPGKHILDGTLGGGGHTESFLQAGARVSAMDRDSEAIAFASKRVESFEDRFESFHGNFATMAEVFPHAHFDGVLLDFGVSSWQLDQGRRGFSFREDGPLDMRMDQSQGQTAADLVNEWSEEELADIFFKYGEEKASRRVAKAIVVARGHKSFERTGELADLVTNVLGGRGRKHPATRVFQALRMSVNDELRAVNDGMLAAEKVLKPGGILAVITFHSLEDRLAKQFFKTRSAAEIDRPEWPEPRANPDCHWRLEQRKPIGAGEKELKRNPRSRSALLRYATKR